MGVQTIKRTIFFYDLFAKFNPNFKLNKNKYDTNFQAFLSKIKVLVKNKDSRRYQQLGDRMLFINELNIKPVPGKMIIQGKLLSVRKDFFPELLNTSTDITRDIDAREEEGIVETTHFIIQQKTNTVNTTLRIAIEHNQFGAKINEFEYYLSRLGEELGIIQRIEHSIVVRDSLSSTKRRIGEISNILVKIHKDNIPYLKNVDNGIWSVFNAAQEHFEEKYITMEFKYDIHEARDNPSSNSAKKSKGIVQKFIERLINNKTEVDNFEKLEVKAEDSDRNDRLNAFDLLIDKAKDILDVQRKEKSRTIVSADMFDKMIDSWARNRIL